MVSGELRFFFFNVGRLAGPFFGGGGLRQTGSKACIAHPVGHVIVAAPIKLHNFKFFVKMLFCSE